METRPRAVITSKKAEQHLEQIKAEHGDLLNGMAMQSQRIQQMNMQNRQQRTDQANQDREYGLKQQALTAKSYGS